MTNEIDQEIGRRIELQRKIQRKSRAWLSDKIKKSEEQIRKYEFGIDRVASSTLFEISKVLNCKIEIFFPDENF